MIDFDRLTPAEIAPIWIRQNECADKDRDQNWSALRDYESDLRAEDPDRALAIILEVLKIETNPNMLSYLAAGPLEDLITLDTIDLIEAEAASERTLQMAARRGVVLHRAGRTEVAPRRDRPGTALVVRHRRHR